MSSEVLYRKWRPRSFSELAGQEAASRTLTNAIAGGKVSHAYLLSGPRGTGKTTTGRLLAKALNCSSPAAGEPCNECESCRAFIEGRALDLVELDAASNRGIDEIRSLREKAHFAPAGGEGASKVYLVDEAHMLTEPAFNALLKILEEPPPHVVFILATTDAHKIPATVVSRCQRFDFRRIPLAAVVDRLAYIGEQEGFTCPRDALEMIARAATGSLRDAINLFEQLIDAYDKDLSAEQVQEGLGLVVDPRAARLAAHALKDELGDGLALIAAVRDDGLDLRQFQRQAVAYLRGLLLVKAGATLTETWSDEQLSEMSELVAGVPPRKIVDTLRAFGEADLRNDPLSPLPLELALASSVLTASAPKSSLAPPTPTTSGGGQPLARPVARPVAAAPRPVRPAAPSDPSAEDRIAPAGNGAAEEGATRQAMPADGPLLDQAKARWPEIYQRTREIDHKAGALLNSGCGIIDASDDAIVFGFRHKMHLDRIQADGGGSLKALQQAVDELLGAGRTVRCVFAPDVEIQRPTGRGGHLVRAAEELGARVIDDEV